MNEEGLKCALSEDYLLETKSRIYKIKIEGAKNMVYKNFDTHIESMRENHRILSGFIFQFKEISYTAILSIDPDELKEKKRFKRINKNIQRRRFI